MTLWDVRCCAPLDPAMIADAARHGVVVTVEDGIRDGGIGMTIADARRTTPAAPTRCRTSRCSACPTRFIPHGKPDRILAQLGLDADGIAATVRGAADLTSVGTGDLDAELELALELADAADAVTLPHFRAADLHVDRKADRTEVTEADRGSRGRDPGPTRRRPGPTTRLLGEEHGLIGRPALAVAVDRRPDRRHVELRPGIPVWATLIALEHDGELGRRRGVGAGARPALVGGPGTGAFADGQPITRVHRRRRSRRPTWPTATSARSGRPRLGRRARRAAAGRAWRARGFGDFWQHVLVAEGAVDVAVEPVVSLCDLAAVQVVVEEAGGTFTDRSTGVAQADAGSACSTNGLLHDEVLAAFAR